MTSLRNISRVLFDEYTSNDELKSALENYKSLVLAASSIDVNSDSYQQHLPLDNGIAIGLKWAASCLDDAIRTQKFILGTKEAIEQKLSKGKKPVRLIYAGTGPFATLILPLLEHFSSEELRVTLIEVNPESVANVSLVLKRLGLENHVDEIYCEDATSVRLPNNGKWQNYQYDILLSETMQHALQAELQVPICANLLSQLSADALLIPQSIHLDLILLKLESGNFVPSKTIGEMMKVDTGFLRKQHPINSEWEFRTDFDLSSLARNTNDFLGIDTTIHVFGEHIIQRNESGLTNPKILCPLSNIQGDQLTVKYVMNPEPHVILEV